MEGPEFGRGHPGPEKPYPQIRSRAGVRKGVNSREPGDGGGSASPAPAGPPPLPLGPHPAQSCPPSHPLGCKSPTPKVGTESGAQGGGDRPRPRQTAGKMPGGSLCTLRTEPQAGWSLAEMHKQEGGNPACHRARPPAVLRASDMPLGREKEALKHPPQHWPESPHVLRAPPPECKGGVLTACLAWPWPHR